MILKYVLTSFGRRKVRTILMILSLMISTGLIVTMSATVETMRQSNIDLIASETGRFDLAVAKKDTSPDPFIPITAVSQQIQGADARIDAVYPRLLADVELIAGERNFQGTIVALDLGAGRCRLRRRRSKGSMNWDRAMRPFSKTPPRPSISKSVTALKSPTASLCRAKRASPMPPDPAAAAPAAPSPSKRSFARTASPAATCAPDSSPTWPASRAGSAWTGWPRS